MAQLGAASANQSAILAANENAACADGRPQTLAMRATAGGYRAAVRQQGQADLGAKLTGQGQNDAAALGWLDKGSRVQRGPRW